MKRNVLLVVGGGLIACVGVLILALGSPSAVEREQHEGLFHAKQRHSPEVTITPDPDMNRAESRNRIDTDVSAGARGDSRVFDKIDEPRDQAGSTPGSPASADDPMARLIVYLSEDSNAKLTEDDKRILELALSNQKDQEAVNALLGVYNRPEPPQMTRVTRNTHVIGALSVLAGAGSEHARKALYDIAMTKDPESSILPQRAARAFASAQAGRPDEIIKLLASDDGGVRIAGVRAIAGEPLTERAAQKLGEQLQSKDVWMHLAVAHAFARDTESQTAGSKIDLLLRAGGLAGQLDKADEPAEGTGPWTVQLWATKQYAVSLAAIKDGQPVLAQRLASETGQRKALVIVAMAQQGNQAVHDQLVGLIQETQDGMITVMSVQALGEIGTASDTKLLKSLRDFDKFSTKDPESGRTIYPVREAASTSLKKIIARD